ncbi:MAG: hydrogenase maturation protease [Kiritimatiellales bacterium]|nr:hydrogenase maturation protease [Kiritimatiellales bacterium]
MTAQQSDRIAVVGVGNLLLSDDGVGVHAVRILEADGLNGISLIDAGTSILHAADLLLEMDRILVIDAVKGGQKPGTVYLMQGNDVQESTTYMSMHSLGLKSALRMLPSAVKPVDWTLLGVEPASLEYGTELSPEVQEVLPDVVFEANRLVKEWTMESPRGGKNE